MIDLSEIARNFGKNQRKRSIISKRSIIRDQALDSM